AEFPVAAPRQYRTQGGRPLYRLRCLADAEHRAIPRPRQGWRRQRRAARELGRVLTDFSKLIAEDTEQWAKVIRAANIGRGSFRRRQSRLNIPACRLRTKSDGRPSKDSSTLWAAVCPAMREVLRPDRLAACSRTSALRSGPVFQSRAGYLRARPLK